MIKKVLQYSIDNKLGHIPSALSMLEYVEYLTQNILQKDWNIIIGKPFGSQTYYKIWEKYWGLDITGLSYGVKHDEIPFVDYSEETLGNALGIASGVQLANNKKTWCNISDGALQMGPTLEAIQFIGKMKQDILLTVDFNFMQLTGKTYDIIGVDEHNMYSYFHDFGWNVLLIDKDYSKIPKFVTKKGPKCIIFRTKKGQGVLEMEQHPITWHYKKLEDFDEITIK